MDLPVKNMSEKIPKPAPDIAWLDQRLRDLLMHGPSAFGVTAGPEHHWVYVSQARADIAGRRGPEDFIGKSVRESYPDLAGQPFFDLLDRVYQTGVPFSGKAIKASFARGEGGRREDVYLDCLYQPIRNQDGQIEGLLIHTVDVTDQVLTQRALELANQREKQLRSFAEIERNQLRELFIQAPAGIALLSGPEHRWTFVNAVYEQIVNHPAAELLNRTIRETLPELEGQGFFELLDQVYRTGHPYIGSDQKVTLHRGPHGALEEAYVDFVYQPSRDPQGAVNGIMVLTVEVTNQVIARNLLETSVQERTSELQRAHETLRDLSAHLLHTQDEERRRVARELHDSAGQYLAALQMNLAFVMSGVEDLPAGIKSKIEDSAELVSRCTAEIRTISYLLHPPLLDEMGLRSAIAWFAEGFAERSGIAVIIDIPEDLMRFPAEVETNVFRIVQQGLANIHRHSSSKTARIRLSTNDLHLSVEISDDGQGLAPEVLARFRNNAQLPGVGIAGMRERIKGMRGTFNILSGDHGTTITATIPYQTQ